jgi:broad specificity phosphatase PhoE
METAILTRHAESAASARNLLNGDPYRYIGLTKTGREQARRLGRELSATSIDLCVTSRFPRTRETADLALEGRPVPRLVLKDLDDVDVGDFEGKPVGDLRAWQRVHSQSEPVPGGESRVDAILRYCQGYATLLAREESTLLVVTHGLPVTAILIAIRGEELPPTLEDVQVHPADPHPVTRDQLHQAVAYLSAWARDQRAAGQAAASE